MKNYIFNLETTKIELHFDKSEFDALTQSQKSDLKSAYLWSRSAGAWVSRSKEPNFYRARQIAKELGFSEEERKGERLSFSEQIERQAERAEARAERYEKYAENAEKRGEAMQKPLLNMHGDISFFTQPNINTSAGRAFTNYRQKLLDRFKRGFDEYRKSEYFKNKAEASRMKAEVSKYNSLSFLDKHVRELDKEVKRRFENLERYETYLKRLESGKKLYANGEELTVEEISKWASREVELIEVVSDKMAFFKNRIDELGGI